MPGAYPITNLVRCVFGSASHPHEFLPLHLPILAGRGLAQGQRPITGPSEFAEKHVIGHYPHTTPPRAKMGDIKAPQRAACAYVCAMCGNLGD